MAINNISTTLRNAACNLFVDAFDGGSSDASGDFTVNTSAFATLLATLVLSNPAFGSASGGQATANSITSGTAVASGTAAVARFRDRDNTTLFDGSVGTSGQDYNLSSLAVSTNDVLTCSAFTFTYPAS